MSLSYPALLLGYDPALLRQLSPAHRAALSWLSASFLLTALIVGAPIGYCVWLVEHSLAASILLAFAGFLMAVNLLRLLNAGGGTPAHFVYRANYRPAFLPPLLFFVLACLLAQPAQLPLQSADVQALVDAHRDNLIEAERHVLARMNAQISPQFVRSLKDCEFVILRLEQLWEHPAQASLATSVFASLATLPFLLAQTLFLQAVRAYEKLRHARSVIFRLTLERDARRAATELLLRYPSFRAAHAMVFDEVVPLELRQQLPQPPQEQRS